MAKGESRRVYSYAEKDCETVFVNLPVAELEDCAKEGKAAEDEMVAFFTDLLAGEIRSRIKTRRDRNGKA